MTICDMISRFEARTPTDTDIEHELAGRVIEELGKCKESPEQAVLFTDARKVADHLLEQYLKLDQDDKAKMAEVYATEECFNKIGGFNGALRKRFHHILADDVINLLGQISDYLQIIPMLESYIEFTKTQGAKGVRHSTLIHFLLNYNVGGEKINSGDRGSLALCYRRDFIKGIKIKEKTKKSIFESLTWGVPEKLREKVRDASSLINVRIRVLENYLKYSEGQDEININNSTLAYYLTNHNIDGEFVGKLGEGSLYLFYIYDFKKGETFKHEGRGNNHISTFNSITFGVPGELKQRVADALSLLPVRERVLKNYCKFVENSDFSVNNLSLSYYLRKYNLRGEKVSKIPDSMYSLYVYDSRNQRRVKKSENVCVMESMTFGVVDEIKKRVMDAMSLAPLRKTLLENYVGWCEQGHPGSKKTNISSYLISHDFSGKKVKQRGKSCVRIYTYDFTRMKQTNRITKKSLFNSITYRIRDETLLAKVKKYSGIAA